MKTANFLHPRTALVLLGVVSSTAHAQSEGAKYFETQVQPLLQANCIRCHDGAKTKGGLRLDSRETLLKGGDSGAAVDLKSPAKSLLLKAISYTDADLKMPPAGKMTTAQIDILKKWVEMGVPFGAETKPVKHGVPQVDDAAKKFWAFVPVQRAESPKVKNSKWPANPIDNFILARLEKAGLAPAPTAGKEALLRRATYDLTGLPPTPDETRAFAADKSPDAYEKVVDRLLTSPHYGEKWGRHWLDLVRYAESNSFERDDAKPFVWRYRDYVIKSLNEDKPYDVFLKEQLAGDELDPTNPDAMIATGYYRLGQWDDEPSDFQQAVFDELDDIVATTSQVALGLTVNCARCHDHKIDPIPQKDYYKFLAFFRGVTRHGQNPGGPSLRPLAGSAEQARLVRENAVWKEKLDRLNKGQDDIEKSVAASLNAQEKAEFKDPENRLGLLRSRTPGVISVGQFNDYIAFGFDLEKVKKEKPVSTENVLCVTESGREAAKTFVLFRGSPQAPTDEVQPGFLAVLGVPDPQIPTPPLGATTTGRRSALANWLASPQNALTARVMANRLWHYHFGRGIVRSANNFGYMGTPPTHPELLDWLADEFVKSGWKMKAMHRLIMTSSTYRMSSLGNAKSLAKDPENDLFWRFDMRRLEAEEVRDSILAVNQTLDTKMGGPSIYPTIPKEVLAGQSVPGRNWNTSKPADQARRSVYVHVKRSLALPILASFDAADTDTTCPVRFSTTQPTQALSMINSAFTNEQAQMLANDLKKQAGPDLAAQVKLGLWRVMQREPNAKEIARGVALVGKLQNENKLSENDALRSYCVVLLNLNEFVYLD